MSTKPPFLQALRKALDQLAAGKDAPLDAKGRTRARILRAAAEHFQRSGYRRASIDEIARDAGVAKGTVYVHFKNKNELLVQVILEEKRRIAPRFRALLDEDVTPAERLRRYLELSIIGVVEAPLSAKLMSGDREMHLVLEEMAPARRAEMARNQALFGELLHGVGRFDELPENERHLRLTVLMAFLYNAGTLVEEPLRGGHTVEELAAHIAKVIVDGVGAP